MKVAFIPSLVSGVMFYRIWQQAEALRKLGHKVAVLWWSPKITMFHPWQTDLPHNPKIFKDINMACQWADVVVWQMLNQPHSLNLFGNMRKLHPKPFLSEYDDDVFNVPSYSPASNVYQNGSDFSRIAHTQIVNSDALIVSTPYLKEAYSRYNDNIHVMENTIDFRLWGGSTSYPHGLSCKRKVNIGWVGGGTHIGDLDMVKEAIFETLEKYKNVTFTCVHGCPEFFKWHKQIKWTNEFKTIDKYPKWVKSFKFDIGIAPLIDNAFNRSKSNLRWLEYSVMGIPTVASKVDHFEKSITDGYDGYLVETKEEWKNRLALLIESEELRRTIGTNAKNTIKEKWTPMVVGRKYADCLKEIYNAKHDKSNSVVNGGIANR